jgi:glycosyltransferase involved in cell wall biosynthesis
MDFTVLMATYAGDDAPLLQKALQSVFSNTLPPPRVICVGDGPVPSEIQRVIGEFIDRPGFTFLSLETNSGLANALNSALPLIETEWVFRADSDDINVEDRFELMINHIKANPSVDIFGGQILEVTKEGIPVSIKYVPCSHEEISKYVKIRNPFNHMTVGFRLNLIKRLGGYPDVHLKEDYALWGKAIAAGCITSNIQNVLVHATTGKDLFKRRGGFKYVKSEFELQKTLYHAGLKGAIPALTHAVVRSSVFAAPGFLREFIYLRLLRLRQG